MVFGREIDNSPTRSPTKTSSRVFLEDAVGIPTADAARYIGELQAMLR